MSRIALDLQFQMVVSILHGSDVNFGELDLLILAVQRTFRYYRSVIIIISIIYSSTPAGIPVDHKRWTQAATAVGWAMSVADAP